MDPQVIRFTKIINHLISLTTRDEYGSSRSRGIETFSEFAEDLNAEGILAAKGEWTENSLKLHISRLKHQYGIDYLMSQCDLELIDRCAWEYSSGTVYEEVQRRKKSSGKIQEQKITKSYPIVSHAPVADEVWKEHELNEVMLEERKIEKKRKNLKKGKSLDTF